MTAPVVEQHPTLEHLAPGSLVLNVNVRTDVDLDNDPMFVESIREHGVLTPVIAHRDEIGRVVVDQGQRRTLAAVRAERTTMPVYVLPHTPDEANRIVEQLTENQHRAELGRPDLVAAVDQLSLVGYTPTQIAKRVSIPKATVTTASKVARSKVAVQHLRTMTLDEAALLVEFEDDEAAVVQLAHEAEQGRPLAAVAERIRQDHAERAAIAAVRAELEANGVTVVDPPDYDDKKTLRLERLQTENGAKITGAQHAGKCPGHVAWVQIGWSGSTREPQQILGCSDWKKQGHVDSWATSGSTRPAAADMTDEERETARVERRHVIESNKDWRAATTVRQQWLRDFAGRSAAPSGAEQLIACAISEGWANVEPYHRTPMWELLGTTPEDVAGELKDATRGRALQISLMICLAAWERELAEDAWRTLPAPVDLRTAAHARMVFVLQAISQWGHELSAIEERVVDGTAHQAEVAA